LCLRPFPPIRGSVVARSEGTTAIESIDWNGTSNTSRCRVYAYFGSGSDVLALGSRSFVNGNRGAPKWRGCFSFRTLKVQDFVRLILRWLSGRLRAPGFLHWRFSPGNDAISNGADRKGESQCFVRIAWAHLPPVFYSRAFCLRSLTLKVPPFNQATLPGFLPPPRWSYS
jgi:hypothetical protein